MKGADALHKAERKAIRQSVESVFEKYRLCKYLTLEDGYSIVADLDIEGLEKRRAFCKEIEQAVKQLPDPEQFLINVRYMGVNTEYITDYAVYRDRFNPPISEGTYTKIRWRAMYRLAVMLGILESDD
ncbi:transcriptional regulator [Brevibacillus parabrevis]|uniref:transcriptional regulator n=1 Tax=Brevibacillus parabrevis TaxID=54914 RepID=UPI002380B73A|nr:transcriptional regulator [Brevibacillus parabrevis]WDV94199.1 transcriptional regulator [Brevibacillus parabrevis]